MTGLEFRYPFTVLEKHLDTFGHVNNAVYLQLYEEARWEFITQRGYGMKEIQEKQQGPVILSVDLQFKRELKLREKAVIISRTRDYAGKTGSIEQEMINSKGEIASTATFKFGFFDMQARRLISPTPEWLHAIGWNNT